MSDPWKKHMIMAYRMAMRSNDPSSQNGSVLMSDENGLVAYGRNRFPCQAMEKDKDLWQDRPRKYQRVIHAEMCALMTAAQMQMATQGTTMICPWAACSRCAAHMVFAGVKRLVRHDQAMNFQEDNIRSQPNARANWTEDVRHADRILRDAGVQVVNWRGQIGDENIFVRCGGARFTP